MSLIRQPWVYRPQDDTWCVRGRCPGGTPPMVHSGLFDEGNTLATMVDRGDVPRALAGDAR